jgi:ferrous iron transport protein B
MNIQRIALAGNPNAGKTTIFNGLTGARQHVGNYPGVTVEMKEGKLRDGSATVIDLPGTYSLSPYSEEERVAREVLWKTPPEVVIDVADAANLERNLYLALQLREFGLPTVLALNMSDLARSKGWQIDIGKLAELLQTPVVETVGHKGTGLDRLIVAAKAAGKTMPRTEHLSTQVNQALDELETALSSAKSPGHPRWLALKLLEGDREVMDAVPDETVKKRARELHAQLEKESGNAIEAMLADQRYRYIETICGKCLRSSLPGKRTFTEKIDRVVLNRYLGLPIFLGLMYLVFQLTFTLGSPLMDWVDALFGWMGGGISGWWPEGSESLLRSLLVDGIIGGVGGVLIFLPNILLLFLAIALLEDTGYMARAAFVMDRIMNKIGLHGKSFIPMLIGFGCSVPAIMATRTMDNKRDRLVTMLVVPLMSCGARLPIYALIIPAFFAAQWQAPLLWGIYLIGIILAILSAKLLRGTLFKGESVPFIMELPAYHVPTFSGVLIHMWERGKLYVAKAGTIILGLSILIWALSTFPKLPQERVNEFDSQREQVIASLETENHHDADHDEVSEASGTTAHHDARPDSLMGAQLDEIDNRQAEAAVEYSAAGRIGKFFEPAIRPLGFDWRIGTGLVGAFAAKEVFVSTLGIVFSVGEADETSESLRDKLRERYDPLIAFCIMLFCLVSAPCMATIAITKRESNSWKWAMFQLVGLTVMAYVLTLLVYQIGRLAGL